MADIIKIILPPESAEKSPVAPSSTGSSTAASSGGSADAALSAQGVVRGARNILAATGIKQIADNVIAYNISTVSLRTGAAEYQQKLQFIYSESSQALSSVAAIGMGALFGGPAGAAVAAVGVGLNYIMKALNWSENANTIRINENREDISIQMQNIRAGSLGRRNGS